MHSAVEDVFGPVVSAYTRAQALEDGILVNVTTVASEAGFKWPVALTRTVYDRYVEVPDGLTGQDVQGRLWDILNMMWVHVRTGKITGASGVFKVLVRFPASTALQDNERRHPAEDGGLRLVTLKTVSGPGDDGSPCITILMPDED